MSFQTPIGDKEAQGWRGNYTRADAKPVERHYTARLIAEELGPRGFEPIEVMPENHPFDLLVMERAVEIKIARSRVKGAKAEVYQGLLHDADKRRHLDGEFVILVCVDAEDRLWPFVIPRLFVGARRTVEITSHPEAYGGQWAPFLGAWEFLVNAVA